MALAAECITTRTVFTNSHEFRRYVPCLKFDLSFLTLYPICPQLNTPCYYYYFCYYYTAQWSHFEQPTLPFTDV
jgi:hypothetical protein